MMNAHIYLVTNNVNGKQYVGQTTIDSNKVGHGTIVTEAYKKYGRSKFTYDKIITNVNNRNTLNYLEKFWIKVFNTLTPNGYNIENGGTDKGIMNESTREKLRQLNLGKKMSAETKKKISISLSGENGSFYGRKHTEESKRKIGKASLGRIPTFTDEAREKIRQSKLGAKNPMYGKPITEEHREKLRKNNARNKPWLGKKFTDEQKAHLSKEYICPHCGKVGKGNAMIRHHLDNCKFKVVL